MNERCTSYCARGFFCRMAMRLGGILCGCCCWLHSKRISFIFFFFSVFISSCEALLFPNTTQQQTKQNEQKRKTHTYWLTKLNEWRCGPPCLMRWCARLTFSDKLSENQRRFVFCTFLLLFDGEKDSMHCARWKEGSVRGENGKFDCWLAQRKSQLRFVGVHVHLFVEHSGPW